MNESDYYQIGTYNNPDAPWNKVAKKPQKIEVTVSITLSKTVEIEVDDYTTEEINEDGIYNTIYNFDNCDLEQAVRNQITLPNSIKEFNDWSEDDFVVNLN